MRFFTTTFLSLMVLAPAAWAQTPSVQPDTNYRHQLEQRLQQFNFRPFALLFLSAQTKPQVVAAIEMVNENLSNGNRSGELASLMASVYSQQKHADLGAVYAAFANIVLKIDSLRCTDQTQAQKGFDSTVALAGPVLGALNKMPKDVQVKLAENAINREAQLATHHPDLWLCAGGFTGEDARAGKRPSDDPGLVDDATWKQRRDAYVAQVKKDAAAGHMVSADVLAALGQAEGITHIGGASTPDAAATGGLHQ